MFKTHKVSFIKFTFSIFLYLNGNPKTFLIVNRMLNDKERVSSALESEETLSWIRELGSEPIYKNNKLHTAAINPEQDYNYNK